MEIRRATTGDVATMAELRKQQLIDEGALAVTDIDRELTEYFTRAIADGSFIGWLAIKNGEVIATSGLCFYQLPPNFRNPSGMVAYVTNMFTVKQHRRQGIATLLLEKILAEARSLGHSYARLHASEEGRGLYEKFGFTASDGYMSLKL